MALTVNDSIQSSSPKSLDNKYGVFASGTFRAYNNVAEANSTISASFRSVGLTVLVNNGSANVEYWYQAGIADGNLVPKVSSVVGTSPITVTSGTVGIQTASSSQAGAIAASDWTNFNGKISSVASTGSGAVNVYAGTSGGAVTIKTLAAGTNITLGDSGGTVTISAPPSYSSSNLGSGAQILPAISGTTVSARSITAGSGIAIVQNTNDISIAAVGSSIPTPSSTASSSPTVITSVTIPGESAGMLVVTMVGVVVGSAGSMTTAQRYVQYYKTGGVLNILGSVYDIIPEQNNTFTTTSWTIIVNGSTNNFDVQVTGQASTNIKWASTIQNYINS